MFLIRLLLSAFGAVAVAAPVTEYVVIGDVRDLTPAVAAADLTPSITARSLTPVIEYSESGV